VPKPYRVSAGGIVFVDSKMLLVRYENLDGSTLLAGPGGALERGENAIQAIRRETREETGIVVQPSKVIFIEDLENDRYKMCKIWMLCEYVGGQITQTPEADQEGIIACGWFTREDLHSETVFPPEVIEHEWSEFTDETWQAQVLPSRFAVF